MKKKAGFTILELLVVISIIGIFSCILILKLNILDKLELKRDKATIVGEVNFCKQKAMATGKETSITFDGSSYRLEFADKDKIIKEDSLKSLKFIEKRSGGQKTSINFLPVGTIIGADSYVFQGPDGASYNFVINPVGGDGHFDEEK